ncbi:hypothetical protein FRC07_003774 [Ceratobasidium sp. 392]|nr:hypothetical protein FRC07_003774 [Ceratobasidium sp. 392]
MDELLTSEVGLSEVILNVQGLSGLALTIPIALSKTVLELKQAIAENCDEPADRQILLFSGRILKDEDSLVASQVQNASTIYMVQVTSASAPLQLLPVVQAGGTNAAEAGMMFQVLPNPAFFPLPPAQPPQPPAVDPQTLQTMSSSLDALRDMAQTAAGTAQVGIDRNTLKELISANSLGALALLGNVTGTGTAGAGPGQSSTNTGTQNGTAGGAPPPTSGEPGVGTDAETEGRDGSGSGGYATAIAGFGIGGIGIGIAGKSKAEAGGVGPEPEPAPTPAPGVGTGGGATSTGGAGAGAGGSGGAATGTGGAGTGTGGDEIKAEGSGNETGDDATATGTGGNAIAISGFGIGGIGIGIGGDSAATGGKAECGGTGGMGTSTGGAGAGGGGTGGAATATGGAGTATGGASGKPASPPVAPGAPASGASQNSVGVIDPSSTQEVRVVDLDGQGKVAGGNLLAESDADGSLTLSEYKQLVGAAFRVQLQQLQDLGFVNAQQNIRALLATGGQVDPSIEYMLKSTGKAKALESGAA